MLGVTLKADISPADLASMAGVPASTVTRIESGKSEHPEEATLKKLAAVLKVPAMWLRYGAQAGLQLPVSGPDAG